MKLCFVLFFSWHEVTGCAELLPVDLPGTGTHQGDKVRPNKQCLLGASQPLRTNFPSNTGRLQSISLSHHHSPFLLSPTHQCCCDSIIQAAGRAMYTTQIISVRLVSLPERFVTVSSVFTLHQTLTVCSLFAASSCLRIFLEKDNLRFSISTQS